MTLQERKDLLTCPNWTWRQVAKYTGYKKSKVYEIIAICKKDFNGEVIFEKHKVKRNSVLAYLGTSIEEELMIIKKLEQQKEEQHEIT